MDLYKAYTIKDRDGKKHEPLFLLDFKSNFYEGTDLVHVIKIKYIDMKREELFDLYINDDDVLEPYQLTQEQEDYYTTHILSYLCTLERL